MSNSILSCANHTTRFQPPKPLQTSTTSVKQRCGQNKQWLGKKKKFTSEFPKLEPYREASHTQNTQEKNTPTRHARVVLTSLSQQPEGSGCVMRSTDPWFALSALHPPRGPYWGTSRLKSTLEWDGIFFVSSIRIDNRGRRSWVKLVGDVAGQLWWR